MRGCTANTTVSSRAIATSAATSSASFSGASTFEGRCSVTTAYGPLSLSRSPAPEVSIFCRNISNESIMMLPMQSIFCGGHALGAQIRIRIRGGRPQEVRDRIRHEAVDLLGHAAVAAAQAGLQVHDRNPQLGADHGTGGRRIDVPHHHDGVRAACAGRPPRRPSWCGRSARRASRCRPPGGAPARAGAGPGRRHPTCSRRSAARCARWTPGHQLSRARAW